MSMEPYVSHTAIQRTKNSNNLTFVKDPKVATIFILPILSLNGYDTAQGLVGYITLGVDTTAVEVERWPPL